MHMAGDWLAQAASEYNADSIESKDAYPAHILIPIDALSDILEWTFQSLPDEILVGMDANTSLPHRGDVEDALRGSDFEDGLFSGQGFVLGNPHLVNRGDSFSVHHVPEEWMDGLFDSSRGVRGGRFSFWLHTHPNAPAIPSGADAESAQWTEGCDMILGVRYSPEGILPWLDGVEGERRELVPTENERPILGRAVTGHLIHGLELIAFHRRGFGINVLLTDSTGIPIGWHDLV
tara:strand:- start:6791 stop:7492 length:702 start_codon:yes stop_codon:yes gene_type:complete